MSTELESSILIGAFIACNKCTRVDAEEGETVTGATEIFFNDGWRVINDLAVCPDCIDKKTNHETKENIQPPGR